MKKTTEKQAKMNKTCFINPAEVFKGLLKSKDAVNENPHENNKKEAVNHPDHYAGNGIEVIDVIEAFGLGFNLGNVIKYVLRAGKKDELIQELSKAKWYLEREIGNLKAKAEFEAGWGRKINKSKWQKIGGDICG